MLALPSDVSARWHRIVAALRLPPKPGESYALIGPVVRLVPRDCPPSRIYSQRARSGGKREAVDGSGERVASAAPSVRGCVVAMGGQTR